MSCCCIWQKLEQLPLVTQDLDYLVALLPLPLSLFPIFFFFFFLQRSLP